MDEYKMACVKCGSISDLEMFAHRGKDGTIRGWYFACPKCRDELKGSKVIIVPEEVIFLNA